MVNHVKLEIAVQIVAEKLAEVYRKIEQAKNEIELEKYQEELAIVFDERDRVSAGEIEVIERILSERGKK